MNVSELMIKCLEAEGVKYIFGVPGEENEDFLFALADSQIEFIPVRHEQGAAFMADVWGRLTGDAGVCLATLGPGATNLITGIADAYLDKAPLVAITGQGALKRLHHESHQVIDVVKMLEPITKWNTSIQDKSIVREVVRKAFKVAEMEKPGATHIELPEDVAGQEVEFGFEPLEVKKARRSSPDEQSIKAALELLHTSEKPLILAGNGAIRNRASQALRAFAQKYNIPVACTFMGKGAISDREKQSVGAVGLGFKDYVMEVFDQADVILTVGYDIAEYDPMSWNPNDDKMIIHLDFEPAEVYDHYIPDVEIVADLAESLRQITDQYKGDVSNDWYTDSRERILSSINSYELKDGDESFHVPGVINMVRSIMDDSGLLISDVGSHKMWIARNFRTFCPNGCIISNGLATMGISLPGAIAAQLVDPSRQIVAMMGDGGAMMNIQELATAVRLQVPITIIIFNDNNYGLIEWKQQMSQGKSFGTKLTNPDFILLGESFGIASHRPKSVSDLRNIINSCISSKNINLIEIPITTEVNQELTENLESYFS